MPSLSWSVTVIGLFAAVLLGLRWAHRNHPKWLHEKQFTGFDALLIAAFMVFAGVGPLLIWHSDEDVVTANFHRQYHDVWMAQRGFAATWLGVPMIKNPLDLLIFQEIIVETLPDLLIETGTWMGGATLYYAGLFDLLGTGGRIVTVDITRQDIPKHPRVEYIVGSSTDPGIVELVTSRVRRGDKVMVTLDSSHMREHVLNELNAYSDLVTPGNYLVVEDTHLNGHPVAFDEGDPWAAVDEFLKDHPEFEQDRTREKHGMTFNPGGWLKRKAPQAPAR